VGTLDANEFWRFCARLTINSKEYNAIKFRRPFGPQRWIVKCVSEGLERDIHDFTILKSRQLGASTIFLALDLYWLFRHGGMDGTLVTQDEQTFANFRTQLSEFYTALPRAYKPYSPVHNRNEFVFRLADGKMSRLQYQIAGSRISTSSKLGRAKGNSYCHGTEVAFWGDPDAFEVLKNSLAEVNPSRLFCWESTANGFNHFEQQWRIATRGTTQQAIFVSWWAHELNRISREDHRFRVYWGANGKMTLEERELAREVQVNYGDCLEYVWGHQEIQPEQIAWYRWYGEEQLADPELMKQERPWVPSQAFITTGSQFFRGADLTAAQRRVSSEPPPEYRRIEVGLELSKCEIVAAPARIANLWIYAGPVKGGHYVLGADPAYGVSEWSDGNCISVWRVWKERCEQVAEFWSDQFQPYMFAWAMVYLAGVYSPCGWNLEVTGPGTAVLTEIENLKRRRYLGDPDTRAMMTRFFGGMNEFFYTRVDSLNRNPIAKGTQSNYREKSRYMEAYKDNFTRGLVVPHSRSLLEEMRWITREVGHAPSGSAHHPDDRVIAAALANHMWTEKIWMRLQAAGVSWLAEQQQKAGEPVRQMTVAQAILERQVQLLGLKPKPPTRLQ
jgi:hypothetical protein